MAKVVKVAAAVIKNEQQDILIAKRPAHVHMGGLWEFPGGKLEPGETAKRALIRELHEELGVVVEAAQPLIQISHEYVDKSVHLDVWVVSKFSGRAEGREGQEVRWVSANQLRQFDFPAANFPIVNAALLPHQCFITGDTLSGKAFDAAFDELDAFVARIVAAAEAGAKLFILRPASALPGAVTLAERLLQQNILQDCLFQWHERWFHGDETAVREILGRSEHYGLHLSAKNMAPWAGQVIDMRNSNVRLSASCHCAAELIEASELGFDFALLSPVKATKQYSSDKLLGWNTFGQLVAAAKLPVFALGGMTQADEAQAREYGAQGVAFIRDWWAG